MSDNATKEDFDRQIDYSLAKDTDFDVILYQLHNKPALRSTNPVVLEAIYWIEMCRVVSALDEVSLRAFFEFYQKHYDLRMLKLLSLRAGQLGITLDDLVKKQSCVIL